MEGITELRKVGGSVVATIPKHLVNIERLLPGQTVVIAVKKVKRSFFGAAKGVGKLTKEDKRWMEGNHYAKI